MKRVGFWVLFGLAAVACAADAPSPQVLPPWQWAVTGMKPGSVALPASLVVCEANGSACAPVKAGVKLNGSKLVRLERGVSEFQLDSGTRVQIGEGSEVLLQDKPRTLELRSGGVALSRETTVKDAGSLTVKIVDRALVLDGRATLTAQMDGLNRGHLFVAHGVVTSVEPVGVSPPVRQFHAGEGALFERKAPPDLSALFAGKLSRLRQTVLAVVDTPPPPPSVTEPRGLGTMTARVPGTTALVGGVRLAKHRVKAVVRDSVAQTEVEEVFQNDTERVLEGRYVFPLPADATITGLTLFVGDEPVEGELVEKKRAAAIFQSIVEDTVRPRDPALLEWVSGSKFSLKIFPIPAKGSRKVVLRYQQVLTSDGPRQTYVYPMSFGAERRTPIDELSIDVELSDGGFPAQRVVPSGYAATVQVAEKATRVAVRAQASAPDHDFAISFGREQPGATVASAEPGFVAVRLRAELPADLPTPVFRARDRVLVIDASHSQSAESFATVQALALGVLHGLEPEERFALLVCDSACDAVPKTGLALSTGQVLAEAKGLLKGRKPAGASDLAGALRAAAERAAVGAAVQVVYVGDGSASAGELSVSSIANRVRDGFERRRVDLRLFGAGASVDEVTLSGLARALSGSYDNVAGAGALAEQQESLVTGLRMPLLVAPTLEVTPDVSDLEPRVLPNLRLGEELVVVGKRVGKEPLSVTLRGRLSGAPYALTRLVNVETTPNALPFAGRLWAQSRIRELTTSGDTGARKELIELSQRFAVMSRETSWLVLENEQMFADFGIKRGGPREGLGPDRGALSQELDQLDSGTLGGSGAASSGAASTPAKRAAAEAAPRAPRSEAPAPAPPSPIAPGASRGRLGGIGSTGAQKSTGAGAGSGQAGDRLPVPQPPPVAVRPLPLPANVAVHRTGDETWVGQGQPALDKLQTELAASPTSRKRHEAVVRALLLRGRFAPALTAAQKFVELDPDLPVARELLAYAAVATGDRNLAVAAVDALTESAPNDLKAQGRAARAFEALGDETRACAHWRSVLELAPSSDSAQFEAFRCRARSMADGEAALRDAQAVARPGPLLQKLLPLLKSGQLPAFERSSGGVGQFEISLTCEPKTECPYAIVITPTGTVFSPWTPALGRSSATSFAFSGLMTGVYRVLLIGGAPAAKGQLEVRALNAQRSFPFSAGRAPTIVATQVKLAPVPSNILGRRRAF